MDEIEYREWLPSSGSPNFRLDENFRNSGNLTLVTFPQSLKSITISWSQGESLPPFFRDSSEIYGKLYYDDNPIRLNYIHHSRIISHSGNDNTSHTEEKNISHLPCQLLILGKIYQKPEFQNLERYEGQDNWSIYIPYSSAIGGIYNQAVGTSIRYDFQLIRGEMSCTYEYRYYADLEP